MFQVVPEHGLVFFGAVGEEDGPAVELEPGFLGDGAGVTAIADAVEADEMVGELDGGDEGGVAGGGGGVGVPASGIDDAVGEAVMGEVHGAEFAVVHAEDFDFDIAEVGGGGGDAGADVGEFVGELGGHDDTADVVEEAGDVFEFVLGGLEGAGDLAGHDGGGDAMLPEATPGEGVMAGDFLEILDDGGGHGQLADLADAEVEDGFLDTGDGGREAVVDGVDEAEHAGGHAGVASDDLGDLGGEALFGVEQFAEDAVDTAEGWQEGTIADPLDDGVPLQWGAPGHGGSWGWRAHFLPVYRMAGGKVEPGEAKTSWGGIFLFAGKC